ncbi:MAG: acyltransferase [Planctomycetota bacterium]
MNAKSLSGRVPELDGIRGIAILLVILWHYGVCLLNEESPSWFIVFFLKTLFSFTWSGVDLFFVLSGFLIGGILIDHKEASNYFKVFYIRRICRIFPLYYFWIFLFISIIVATSSEPSNLLFRGPLPVIYYTTFTQNFLMANAQQNGAVWVGMTWSICIEEQFYLILPFLIRFVPLNRLPHLLITLIISVPLIRVLGYPEDPYSVYLLLHCRADTLLLGVLCAYLIRKEHLKNYLTTHKNHLYSFLFIFFILILVVSIPYNLTKSDILRSSLYFLGALFYTCFLVIALVDKQGILHRVLTHRFLQFFGILAYGMYLFHQVISALAHDLLLNQSPTLQTPLDIVVTGLAFGITTFLAYLSWNFFEKPIVLFGQSFNYQTKEEIESSKTFIEKN